MPRVDGSNQLGGWWQNRWVGFYSPQFCAQQVLIAKQKQYGLTSYIQVLATWGVDLSGS